MMALWPFRDTYSRLAVTFQDALDGSMRYDYGGPEPLNAVANLRLSQSRPEEAAQSAEEAFRRLALCGGCTFFFVLES